LEEESLQELISYFDKNKAKLSKERRDDILKLIKDKVRKNDKLSNKIVKSKVFRLACLYIFKDEVPDKINAIDWSKIIFSMAKINQYLLDHKKGHNDYRKLR
jgi:hypothetical protein